MQTHVCPCCGKKSIFDTNPPVFLMRICGHCKHYIEGFAIELENRLVRLANGLMVVHSKVNKDRLKKAYTDWYQKWDMAVDQRFNVNLPIGLKVSDLNKKVSWEYLDLLCPTMRGIKNDRA